MNITLKNTDSVNAVISINIDKKDYEPAVESSLKKFRQRAEIPGFRKGKAPLGMIKKLYGDSVLADEINKLVGDNLYSYIRENKLNVLGEPLPNETEQKEIDFRTQDNFDFLFDIALAPEMQVALTKEDELPYYTIKIDDEMIDKQIESYRSNYGSYNQVDTFSGKDMLKGTLTELTKGNKKKRDGLVVEEAVMMPSYIKDETEKALFDNAKKGDAIVFTPSVAYEGNAAEIASFLKIEKEQVADFPGSFKYEIDEITHYEEAALDQALFDRVFTPGEVTTEEEFRNRIRQALAEQFEGSSKYKFSLDVRQLIDEKTKDIVFPEDFLKRWLLASDKERTPETLENEFPKIIADLRLHLAKEQLAKDNQIELAQEDLIHYAKEITKAQFAQYGMMSIPEDIQDKYAQDMLSKEDTARNVADRAIEDKLMRSVKDMIKTDDKEISLEEFNQLFEGTEKN